LRVAGLEKNARVALKILLGVLSTTHGGVTQVDLERAELAT
tara:strand:- start:522 stop:644 length:123 start_codon:yes stop_codon:yes gene_type:complete